MKWALVVVSIFFALYIVLSFLIYESYEKDLDGLKVKQYTMTEAIMFCQELAAKKTREDWGYQECIAEVGKTLKRTTIVTL